MTKNNTTKKALGSSIFALFMCVMMLIGTTFAWFTDTASTAVNKIQAGTLDVALQMYDESQGEWVSAEGQTLQFKKAAGATDTEVLWEPGCTYELPKIRVINNGNLALKYKIQITGIQGSAKLNEVIDWTINNAEINLTEKELLPEAMSEELIIKGHMQESAGNEYQGLSIDGIAITVYATQLASENDSYGNYYDANSTYPVEIVPAIENATMSKTTGAEGTAETYNYANSDKTTEVSVPASAVNGDLAPVLTVKPTTANESAAATIKAEGKDAIAYDIKVTNLKENNTEKITVQIYIGTGLTGVAGYHNSQKMSDSDFTYDSTTGYVTIKTASFSAFTIAYDKAAKVSTSDELVAAIKAGKNVSLSNDIQLKEIISLDGKDLYIQGNGYTLYAPKIQVQEDYGTYETSRIMQLNDTSTDCTITLSNLNLDASGTSRAISLYGNTGKVKLILDGCKVTSMKYPINVVSDNSDIEIIARNSTITGYCALQTRSAGTKISCENCTLIGRNQWANPSTSADNDFAVIVVNYGATNSNLTFKNCKIKAIEEHNADEAPLDIRVTGVKLTFNGCKFFVNDKELTADEMKEDSYLSTNPELVIK